MVDRFDPRVTPARPDLAALHLQGKVEAQRFAAGTVREVADPQAAVRHAPSPDAPLDTQALKGEHVIVYEETDEGWSWGQLASDHYVGWLPSNALAAPGPLATHWVSALRTLVFPEPSIKLPPVEALPFGSRIAVTRLHERFAVTTSGGYVPSQHLSPLGEWQPDFVAVAERFLGAPYLWGGKTSLGLDCSGLVQVPLMAAGVSCPRDSDMQQQALGYPIADGVPLQRGDLVFWQGHVAIARDAATLIHANAFHMSVAIEPIDAAVRRIAASGSEVATIRRLAPAVARR